MNKILILSSMFLFCFMSCTDKSSPDINTTDLKSGGTFKITASTGTTKIMNFSNSGGTMGTFWLNKVERDSVFSIILSGSTDAGDITLEVYISNNLQLDVNYSMIINNQVKQGYSGSYIGFSTWVKTVGVSNATIQFSRFQYPGRITATIIKYDVTGKILETGELDFISVKPQI